MLVDAKRARRHSRAAALLVTVFVFGERNVMLLEQVNRGRGAHARHCHSDRRSETGSNFRMRSAGSTLAATATASSAPTTATNVTGSFSRTPHSRFRINPDTPYASARSEERRV